MYNILHMNSFLLYIIERYTVIGIKVINNKNMTGEDFKYQARGAKNQTD